MKDREFEEDCTKQLHKFKEEEINQLLNELTEFLNKNNIRTNIIINHQHNDNVKSE